MNFTEYAEVRLGLEARLRETYEEEFLRNAELDLERQQLVKALQENFAKYGKVHCDAEELRTNIKRSIANLEADWQREEDKHGK